MGNRGFTLIETMVVVAIAGVLTGLAVTGLQGTIASSLESKTARSVGQLMKRARTSAIARHERVGVRIDAVRHVIEVTRCRQSFGAATCVAGPGFVVDSTATLSFASDARNVFVDAPAPDATAANNSLVWNADGTPAISGTSVWRFDHKTTPGAQEVLISVGGDVRVQSSTTPVVTNEI